MDKYIVNDNKVYELVTNDLMSYYKKVDVPEIEPRLSWSGGNISLSEWQKIKNICAFTYDEHNSECMIRLYYNVEAKTWKTCFFPQKMSGMTVKDEFDAKILKEDLVSMEDGYVEAGSVHHHCASTAFQSGTDQKDEANTPGLHITLGNINKSVYDIHSRYNSNDGFQTPKLLSFFDCPDWLNQIPEQFKSTIIFSTMQTILLEEGDPDKADPIWIERIIPKTTTSYYGQTYPVQNGLQTTIGMTQKDYADWKKKQKKKGKISKNGTCTTEGITDAELDELNEEKINLYNDILIDIMVPNHFEMEDYGFCCKHTTDTVKALIVTKRTQYNEVDYDRIRQLMDEVRVENSLCTLTDLHKYIKENANEIDDITNNELLVMMDEYNQYQPRMHDQETKGDDDEMGKTNHNVSTPIL